MSRFPAPDWSTVSIAAKEETASPAARAILPALRRRRRKTPIPLRTAAPGDFHALRRRAAIQGLVRKQAGSSRDRCSGYLLWSGDAPGTTYIVLPAADPAARTLLLRMVRAIAARTLLAAGWIPLHAACVTTAAGAVCLVGGHGGGKTTAMLRLLNGALRPVAFVANDKVFLSPAGAMEICALPAAVGLRAPTIQIFPQLSGWPAEPTAPHDSDAAFAHDTHGTERRTYLPAHRIAEAFAVSQSAGGTLAALIDVAYRGSHRSAWRLLTAQERLAALQAACLPDGLLDDPHEHSRLHAGPARPYRELRLQRCADALPAAAFEPGGDAAQVLASAITGLLAQEARSALP